MIESQGTLSEHNSGGENTLIMEATMEEMEDDGGVITQDTETMDSQINFMEDEYVQSLDQFLEDIEYEN
jgi:hypothetical protein